MKKYFKFWCQKVLPLVYDDSLSYVEVLYKVVEQLNKLAENNDAISDAISELKEYVDTYFEGLDVKAEIEAALDKMLEDGDFDTLLGEFVAITDAEIEQLVGAVYD